MRASLHALEAEEQLDQISWRVGRRLANDRAQRLPDVLAEPDALDREMREIDFDALIRRQQPDLTPCPIGTHPVLVPSYRVRRLAGPVGLCYNPATSHRDTRHTVSHVTVLSHPAIDGRA